MTWEETGARANHAMDCLRSAADAAVMGGRPSKGTPSDKRLAGNKPRPVKASPRPPRKGKP